MLKEWLQDPRFFIFWCFFFNFIYGSYKWKKKKKTWINYMHFYRSKIREVKFIYKQNYTISPWSLPSMDNSSLKFQVNTIGSSSLKIKQCFIIYYKKIKNYLALGFWPPFLPYFPFFTLWSSGPPMESPKHLKKPTKLCWKSE